MKLQLLWYSIEILRPLIFLSAFYYPASRGFSLAWLLAFRKSFAWLVCRVVGLFICLELQNRQRSSLHGRHQAIEGQGQEHISQKWRALCWSSLFFSVFAASPAALIAWFVWERFDPESLQGEKVVICGASRGIGEELAYQYMKFGAQLLLVTRQEAVLQKIVAHCGKLIGCSIASYM